MTPKRKATDKTKTLTAKGTKSTKKRTALTMKNPTSPKGYEGQATKSTTERKTRQAELKSMERLVEAENEFFRGLIKAQASPSPANLPKDLRLLGSLASVLSRNLFYIQSCAAKTAGPLASFERRQVPAALLRVALIVFRHPLSAELAVELTGHTPPECCRLGEISGASAHAALWAAGFQRVLSICERNEGDYGERLAWITRKAVPWSTLCQAEEALSLETLREAVPIVSADAWSTLDADLERERVAVARARGARPLNGKNAPGKPPPTRPLGRAEQNCADTYQEVLKTRPRLKDKTKREQHRVLTNEGVDLPKYETFETYLRRARRHGYLPPLE